MWKPLLAAAVLSGVGLASADVAPDPSERRSALEELRRARTELDVDGDDAAELFDALKPAAFKGVKRFATKSGQLTIQCSRRKQKQKDDVEVVSTECLISQVRPKRSAFGG